MRTSVKSVICAAVGVLALAGCAAESADGDAASASALEAASSSLEFQNLRRTLEIAHDKFKQLAEAMPEESYSWAPMEGVRSVGDVYQHISADNYFVPSLMGMTPPEGTGVTNDVMTFRAFQEVDMTKAEIVGHVDASFTFMFESMDATVDELDRVITLGNSDTTVGDVWIRAITHLHEHLGQSIAYARSNEVVPPWSM
jgi:DinB family protein